MTVLDRGMTVMDRGMTVLDRGMTVMDGGMTVVDGGMTALNGEMTVLGRGMTVMDGGMTVLDGGMTVNMPIGPGAYGHITIYRNPASVFVIATPIKPSFRRKPESMPAGSITVVGDDDAGFRLSPE